MYINESSKYFIGYCCFTLGDLFQKNKLVFFFEKPIHEINYITEQKRNSCNQQQQKV